MILVTGPTGFVGRQVVAALAAGGHPVRALVHTESRASVLSEYGVELAYGDILHQDSLRNACEGVEGVLHLVAVVREKGVQTFQSVNHQGTRNLVQAADAAGVRRRLKRSSRTLPVLAVAGRACRGQRPHTPYRGPFLCGFRRG